MPVGPSVFYQRDRKIFKASKTIHAALDESNANMLVARLCVRGSCFEQTEGILRQQSIGRLRAIRGQQDASSPRAPPHVPFLHVPPCIANAVALKVLVIEAIEKTVCVSTRSSSAMLRRPYPFAKTTDSFFTTAIAIPGTPQSASAAFAQASKSQNASLSSALQAVLAIAILRTNSQICGRQNLFMTLFVVVWMQPSTPMITRSPRATLISVCAPTATRVHQIAVPLIRVKRSTKEIGVSGCDVHSIEYIARRKVAERRLVMTTEKGGNAPLVALALFS